VDDLSIYVGTFVDPCRQKAVLAHEIVHYFQQLTDGIIPVGAYQEDMKRMAREMQAYGIEERYTEFFCIGEASTPTSDRSDR
jgi:hypothetical protein